MWLTVFYIAFFREHDLFFKSMDLFTDWSLNTKAILPFDLKIVYFAEASYYMHAVYATLFLDAKRHDTTVMVLHHFVTLALIIFSYILGYLKIGVLIFVLDDISDVFLEIGKIASYLRNTRYGYSKIAEIVSLTAAVLFAVSWFFCRIIFHLTKVWRGACLGTMAKMTIQPVPFWFFLNALLGCLYFFYVYWFWYIMNMVVTLLTKGTKDVTKDTRELQSKKSS